MDSADGLGEAVTGGLLASAAEPASGQASEGRSSACFNCRTPTSGNYCPDCGQHVHVRRSLGAFCHDLLHGVLHFEGKIWRTLPLLAVRPGELTRRYLEGERARFVSPMALFLFSVFTMFAVFSAVGGPIGQRVEANALGDHRYEVTKALEQEQRTLAELRQDRAGAPSSNSDGLNRIDAEIAATEKGIQALRGYVAAVRPEKPQVIGLQTGWSRLDKGIQKINEDPALATYKVQNNAYKFSWLLIPISLPFMWLLFPFRRGTSLYDHTVFITYSIAAMSIFLVLLALARTTGIPERWIAVTFTVLPPVHIFLQLRGTYGLGVLSSLVRTCVLLAFTAVTLSLFLAALIVLGALA